MKAELWKRRGERVFENSVLPSDFDDQMICSDDASYERLVYGEFDGDMRLPPEPELQTRIGQSCEARKKRRTTPTDDVVRALPDEPPTGWADPERF